MTVGQVESLWFQAGMVGVFMAFTLVIFSYFLKFVKERNEQQMKERLARDEEWREFLAKQNTDFVVFLTTEREQRKESMHLGMSELDQVTAGLTLVTGGLKDLATALGAHDTGTRHRHDLVIAAITKINGVKT